MIVYEIIGWIGFSCALIMFLPQVIKVLRTKSVYSLSISSFLINFFGASMYVLYGTAIQPKSYQAFACNAIIMLFMLIIMFYIFRRRKKFFLLVLAYAALIFTISFLFIFLLKGDLPIAIKYLFVILGGGAIGCAFIPQLKKMLVEKVFKSYSLPMAILVVLNTFPWIIYWIGTIMNMSRQELPTGFIALTFTITQGFIQGVIIYLYLDHMHEVYKHNLNQRR